MVVFQAVAVYNRSVSLAVEHAMLQWVDGLPLGVLVLDGEGKVHYGNQRLTEVLGVDLVSMGKKLSVHAPINVFDTVGGMVAAGLSGPRRATAGAVRDFMLGAVLMNASGELLHFGGQVMKNVAGYDVSRLLAGSMGILGPIVQVSLKVLPVPAAEATVCLSIGLREALSQMNRWGAQPLPLSGTSWAGGELMVRLSGAGAAVDAAVARLAADHGTRLIDPMAARAHWSGLREQTDAFFDDPLPLWRLSVPSGAPIFELPGRQLVEWGGALRWFKSDADAAFVRQAAATVGGTATRFRAAEAASGVFPALPAPILELHRRIKKEFDPRGLFNPGRLVAGL